MSQKSQTQLSRRDFAKALALSGISLSQFPVTPPAFSEKFKTQATKSPFKMKFAPHQGHFKQLAGNNILDQIRFAYDMGFRAWEDNGMPKRSISEQKQIGDLLAKLGMEMGVFVAYADFKSPLFSGNRVNYFDRHKRSSTEVREVLAKKMTIAVETAKRCGAKWCTVVPGTIDLTQPVEYQTQNVVEHLSYMAEIADKNNLIIVLEPLNYQDHPNCFLTKISQAHQICKMVASPACKILNDLYHQQITEGNLIQNLNDAWDEIAYIQIADVPGRHEPGTGEINYSNIMRWLHNKGYTGIVGAEHGTLNKGIAGERQLINAYQSIDV